MYIHPSIFAASTPIEHSRVDPRKVPAVITLLNTIARKMAIVVFWGHMRQWSTPEALAEDPERNEPNGTQETGKTLSSSPYLASASPDISGSTSPTLSSTSAFNTLAPPKASSVSPTPHQTRSKARTHAIPQHPSRISPEQDQQEGQREDNTETGVEWKQVIPSDKELIRYVKWKWAYHEGQEWIPDSGVTRKISEEYLHN
ncbi:hypothetical protein BJ138DRAFT_1131423 [Hygrophoropsis aurantiaca]|uniref:Uncharacterized protein n=1 Tax=Hygrophoropsis aurantiaca TaxID=72124 RepID=A0ACB7ZR75_9AGAM|nr:hypothetical protein BJ138DRAFT_1131423 [Hygrophoropsis aurantiaca]